MYNLAIRSCTSPSLLALRFKMFIIKFLISTSIKPRTCWTRHASVRASAADLFNVKIMIMKYTFSGTIYSIGIIRVFCPGAGLSLQTQAPRLQFCPKAGLSPQTQEQTLRFYQGFNRCGSFSLLSAPHSLFSFWTDLKRSEKIPETPTWRWGEWTWLTGPSGLHRNSPQGLNISSIRVLTRSEIRKSRTSFAPPPL